MEKKTPEVYIINIERGDQGDQNEQGDQGDRHESVCCSRQSIAVLIFLVIIGVSMLLLIFFNILPEGHSISFRLIFFLFFIFVFLGFFLWVTLVSLISENCVF